MACKELILMLVLVGVCSAQRPPYASKPVVYPQELPQYSNNTGASGTSSTVDTDVGDRFGEGNRTTTPGTLLPGSIYPQETINQVSQWPDDKKPFWFLNNPQVTNHTGFKPPTSNQQQQPSGSGGNNASSQSRPIRTPVSGTPSNNEKQSGWLTPGKNRPSPLFFT